MLWQIGSAATINPIKSAVVTDVQNKFGKRRRTPSYIISHVHYYISIAADAINSINTSFDVKSLKHVHLGGPR